LEVRRLGAGMHEVGGVSGLHLQVSDKGGRSWLLRARVGTKRREIGLGPYPEVSLAAAREKAAAAKEAIRAGTDPVQEKKAARAALVAAQRRGMTFVEVWKLFAAEKVKEFSTDKYREQWRAGVERHVIADLGPMMVQDIGLHDVLRVLTPLWDAKTVTAVKLRERIEKVFAYATVHGYRTGDNPARWRGNLDMVLASPSKVAGAENYPALKLDDAPRWWAALAAREGMGARALQFQAMTATRSGAIRFATWPEIDFAAKIWTIQPGRQAAKIPNGDTAKRIPLTEDMISLLKALPKQSETGLIFWAPRGGPLSDATLGKVMRVIHTADVAAGGRGFVDAKTGEAAVPHGLRSTFRTWIAERTTFDGDLAEVALFHKVGSKVAQAYNRADMVEKRRRMMADWLAFLRGVPKTAENVVPIAAAQA
jgi:integrase